MLFNPILTASSRTLSLCSLSLASLQSLTIVYCNRNHPSSCMRTMSTLVHQTGQQILAAVHLFKGDLSSVQLPSNSDFPLVTIKDQLLYPTNLSGANRYGITASLLKALTMISQSTGSAFSKSTNASRVLRNVASL